MRYSNYFVVIRACGVLCMCLHVSCCVLMCVWLLFFVLNSFYFVPFVFCVGYLCVVVGFRFALDMSV